VWLNTYGGVKVGNQYRQCGLSCTAQRLFVTILLWVLVECLSELNKYDKYKNMLLPKRMNIQQLS